ncbi:HAD hydrolase family protein [Cellulomonas aerilata]|uniref:Haloacid dehalogenase n=1 Tax=Cellulomonas aerilata TaxID=515326 RepID=A0A512DBJ8_9CELL|nr:HAD hydrolase family protein [Cellulomonas aerilata]GEO33846.1 haloacid dehalogenase [Cellulomonas aerilata]
MATRRAVFLDVDGTYADRGIAPAGHVAAVRAARANGHLVLLCTGRPRCMVLPRLLEAGFDGVVAAAGGYVEVGGVVLRDIRFPGELADRVVRVLDSHGVVYVLEAPDVLLGPSRAEPQLRELLTTHVEQDDPDEPGASDDVLESLRTADVLTGASFGKVTVVDSPVPVPALAAEIGPEVGALPSSLPGMARAAGELYLAGVHKAAGIDVVARHLGFDRRDVIAFGDGMNDVEMLAHAGVGVAIEGAHPRVLAAADRTAPGPALEGLATAFAELGLV